MKMMTAVLFYFFLGASAHAQLNTTINAAFRTDPRAKNLTATVAYDYLLHGTASKETPFYGYTRVGAIVGGSPTLAGFLQVAPIAPVIFGVQKSRTVRFENADRFDCQSYQCQGVVDRTEYSVRGVVAYKKVFLSPSFMWREIQTDPDTRPVYIEQEVLTTSPGFHRFRVASAIVGYVISENQQAGLIYTENEHSEKGWRSHTSSAFFRRNWGQFVATVGLSRFKYEQLAIEGTAGFLSLDLNFGEKLSLF